MSVGANRRIVLVSCEDQPGIVWKVTGFMHERGGNIEELEQHVDGDSGHFFMRVEVEFPTGANDEALQGEFNTQLAEPLSLSWRWHNSTNHQRLAVFVSKESHCLLDILARTQAGEWPAEVAVVVSNHEHWLDQMRAYGVACVHVPVVKGQLEPALSQHRQILHEHRIDCVVLARYMQLIPAPLLQEWQWRMINIHHSFLPAFEGARPYHNAHQRGVKLVGATAHYVTDVLDQGPIIAQSVVPVRHTDSVEDLKRKGRDIEKTVLARAIWHQLRRDILVHQGRTIVFGE